jgi:transposase InsO family protein
VEQRQDFVRLVLAGELPMKELCRQFEISRKTGYKWLERFLEHGRSGLVDRSSAPRSAYQNTRPETVAKVVAARQRFPYWGPRKLKAWLEREQPDRRWPAASTIGELLKRHGLVKPRRRRLRVPLSSQPLAHADQPNRVWTADFKGHFRVGGHYCYPLTVSDAWSRYLLCCQALSSYRTEHCLPTLEAAFREYGLPGRIRTDNGPPFASRCSGGLSRLSVWWVKLGIVPERIEPGQPQQNGRHERMHRTLKAQVTRPPKRSRSAQQRAFNRFRKEYNELRPHEALGQTPPADHYRPSTRPYRPPEDPDYPGHFQVRLVNASGSISLRCQPLVVGKVLGGEYVGIEAVAEGRWTVWFGPVLLGSIFERAKRQLEFLQHRPLGTPWVR